MNVQSMAQQMRAAGHYACDVAAHDEGAFYDWAVQVESLQQQLAAAREALQESEHVLALTIPPNDAYPYGRGSEHDAHVIAIADEVGYGHLMHLLSAEWRRKIASDPGAYGPPGGEFVAGPCRLTVDRTLSLIRATLQRDRQP